MKRRELADIPAPAAVMEKIAAAITRLLREELYAPLLEELGTTPRSLQNATDDLRAAIRRGRIYHHNGAFHGKLNAALSRELRELGAEWDRSKGVWKLPLGALPKDLRQQVASSAAAFDKTAARIESALAKVLPDQIAEKLKVESLLDRAAFDVASKVQDQVRAITISPTLSAEARRFIAEQYTNNLKLSIRKWTEAEVQKLRKGVQKRVLAGERYEGLAEQIQESYGVGRKKALFLARQETNIMTAKLKAERYTASGITEYKWVCVAGSAEHPVRDDHFDLGERSKRGETFFFSDPPVTNRKTGARNNPGEDFRCRCYARPVVKF
jgi:SPP1 gp7 family putative phage head morphogenesis protein